MRSMTGKHVLPVMLFVILVHRKDISRLSAGRRIFQYIVFRKMTPHSQSNKLDDFLGSITVDHVYVGNEHTKSVDARILSVTVDETRHTFRIDTGADDTLIPKSIYDEKFQHKILHSAQTLRSPDIKPLRALGYFKAIVKMMMMIDVLRPLLCTW